MHSLPKNRRLHKAAEFSATIRFQCKVSGHFLQIYTMPNQLAYSRLGLIVAKKVERRAVKRNWVKRLLREVFRLNQQEERAKNLDWVIRLRYQITKNDAILLTTEAKSLMLELQKCHD